MDQPVVDARDLGFPVDHVTIAAWGAGYPMHHVAVDA